MRVWEFYGVRFLWFYLSGLPSFGALLLLGRIALGFSVVIVLRSYGFRVCGCYDFMVLLFDGVTVLGL